MNTLSIVLGLMAVATCVLAGSDQVCEVKGHGKMIMYTRQSQRIKIPCRYRVTTLQCQGYEIRVTPGQAFNGESRYYVDTVWIAIYKLGTAFYWKGRTSTKLAQKHFETQQDPFNMRRQNLKKADFSIVQEGDAGQNSVTLGVSDADFSISFRPYDYDGKMSAQKKAGVTITCPEAEYLENYPKSLCGNDTDTKVIRYRKKELGLKSMTQTVLHDILDSDVLQTNPQCEVASNLIQNKCEGKKAEALQACSPLVNYGKHTRCLSKFHYDPMNVFVYCLRYMCRNDALSCEMMKDAIQGCNNVHGLSKIKCPVS